MSGVVLDTNIIISALFWGRAPGAVYSAALDRQYVLLTSDELTAELRRVIGYPKFVQQLITRNLDVETIIANYQTIAIMITPAEVPNDVIRDGKDRDVLACAVGGKADYIVSGDKDLLVLAAYENIPILTADQFLAHFSTQTTD